MKAFVFLALLCGLSCASARMSPVPGYFGRDLLQAPNCARIPNCGQCYNAKNDDAVTVLVCRVCNTGYRPTSDGSACECAPGYAAEDGTTTCSPCSQGSYCTGGSATAAACGTGLTTLTQGSRSVEQCVTTAGYGYSKTRSTNSEGVISATVTAVQCDINFYNPGSNTLPCRRCPGGLVTQAAGSSNVKQCMAGPGYLFDKMVAKPCPRGTYKGVISTATACSKCPAGLTTPTTASLSNANCTQALPGYKIEQVGISGSACPRNTYNPGFNNATQCTPCATNMVTLSTTSKSEASCLAPPGFGFDPEATPDKTSLCAANTYKSGFNRKGCSTCGVGFKSAVGSDSKQKCYVPTGHGTIRTSDTETQVAKCTNGTFGYAVDTYGVFTLPCRPCQAGMTTMDANDGVDPTIITNVEPNDCYTLPGYGYDRKAQAAKLCDAGSYAAGWSKDPCMLCPDGYTTANAGQVSNDSCVIAPGWYWDERASQAVPCDEGFYCLGLTLNASATPCPTGTTTSKEGSEDIASCDVCIGGYGGYTSGTLPSCQACAADTYGPKGSTAACSQCADNGVAAPQSDSAGDCYTPWQALGKDYDFLPVAAAPMMEQANGSTELECKSTCDTRLGCVFYQFDDITDTCALYITGISASEWAIGFKIDVGVYSVFPGDQESGGIGVAIRTPSSPSVRDCVHECDNTEGCVVLVIRKIDDNTFTCGMKSGALSADLKSQYKVAGANIGSWTFA